MNSPGDFRWRWDLAGFLEHIPTGYKYAESDLSFFLWPEPGVYLIDTRGGPQRIPVHDIDGLSVHAVQQKIRYRDSSTKRSTGSEPDRTDNLESVGMLVSPSSIAVAGNGPRTTEAVSTIVRERGSEVVGTGDSGAEILVIGQDDWYIDDVEDQIRARSGKRLLIFCQEMFLDAVASGRNPYSPLDGRALESHKDHPALSFCQEDGIDWIDLDTSVATTVFDSPFEPFAESPLNALGYRAGPSSKLSPETRRAVLEASFSGSLPSAELANGTDTWGQPGTWQRLRRIARSLESSIWSEYVQQREAGKDAYATISEWKADLAWLRDTHYRQRMHFRWPSIRM